MSADTEGRKPGVVAWPAVALLLVAAVGAGLWFGAATRDEGARLAPPQLSHGTAIPNPRPLADFALVDQAGSPFGVSDLKGHWTFLAIGYTSCPHICPMTMATFKSVAHRLVSRAHEQPRFLLVSTDPQRDTPQRLAEYVHSFNPDFLGATGDEVQLRALTAQLGLVYARLEAPDASGDEIDHSASILLVDPQGRLAAVFSAPHDAAGLAADFQTIANN